MSKSGEYNEHQARTGGVGPYIVKLLLREPTMPDAARMLERLRAKSGRVDPTSGREEKSPLGFAYPDDVTDYKDRKGVPCMHFFSSQEGLGDRTDLDLALGQTWGWAGARDAVSRASSVLIFNDMMASGIDRKRRLELIVNAIGAAVRDLDPLAIHWLPSQRVVDPQSFIDDGPHELRASAVNARLFRVDGKAPGEMVMDTLGMAAFGLPDVQCHFVALEPGRVASMLYSYASYLFERGDAIEDGHTVEGIVPGTKWKCRHEMALVPPERAVLDINPGPASPERKR